LVEPQNTWPGVPARTGPSRSLEPQATPLVRFLQERPRDGAAPVRILPTGSGFMDNEWMAFGIASAAGYHPAKLQRFENLVHTSTQTIDPHLVDLFNVRYIVLPERHESTTIVPIYDGADGAVYENPRALPRAWVTGRWERAAGPDAVSKRLLADDFDREHVVLLEQDPTPAPDAAAQGEARVTTFSANRVVLDVQASAPGVVVLAEAYHTGWRARVDGKDAPVWPADAVLRAVPVPAGASKVELRFVDPALRRGLWITIASCAGVLALIGAGVVRGRRAAAMEPA